MTRKVREIQDLVIDEISLVDKGANQHATVTIAKSADGEKENYMDVYDEQGNPLDPDALDIGDVVFDADGDAYEIQAENDDEMEEYEDQFELEEVGKSATAIRGAGKLAGSVRHPARSNTAIHASNAVHDGKAAFGRAQGKASGAAHSVGQFGRTARARVRNGPASGYGPQLPAAPSSGSLTQRAGVRAGQAGRGVTSWGQQNAGRAAFVGATTAAAGGGSYYGSKVKKSMSATDLREELSKALTDRDRDDVISKAFGQIEELSKAAEAAQWAAEEERDIRLTAEYVEIAKSYELPNVEVDELAQALKHMAETLPYEDCEVIGKALQFAAEAQDALYYELGSVGGGDNSDVLQMVDAHVDGYVGKSGVSREELTTEVFANNPEAYDQYLAERG